MIKVPPPPLVALVRASFTEAFRFGLAGLNLCGVAASHFRHRAGNNWPFVPIRGALSPWRLLWAARDFYLAQRLASAVLAGVFRLAQRRGVRDTSWGFPAEPDGPDNPQSLIKWARVVLSADLAADDHGN